jgi:hypothetical protein
VYNRGRAVHRVTDVDLLLCAEICELNPKLPGCTVGTVAMLVYERQQVSKRGRGIEHVLIDRIKGASEQLWTVVNPTLDEITENAEVWFDDRETAAEVLATPDTWFGRLSVATDVLGTRESNAEDEERIRTMEDANGGHN